MTFTLYNQDGVVATAQEVYDALMAGTVYLHAENGYHLVTRWYWFDSTGWASDETDVVGVVIYIYGSDIGIAVGTVPEEAPQ